MEQFRCTMDKINGILGNNCEKCPIYNMGICIIDADIAKEVALLRLTNKIIQLTEIKEKILDKYYD